MQTSRRRIASALLLALGAASWTLARAEEKRTPSLENPTPDDARHFAETIVSLAKRIDGVTLDYSPDSLRHVDRIVLKFRTEGNTTRQVAKALVAFGCYVGEVMVRNLKARWDYPNERERRVGFDVIGVRMDSGGFWNPIGKVFKLMENGDEDSVVYFYSGAGRP